MESNDLLVSMTISHTYILRCTTFNIQYPWAYVPIAFCCDTSLEHHLPAHKCGRWACLRGVIRHRLTHTATDSRNQQKKEEEDSRVQLVSPDKAFCVTSD